MITITTKRRLVIPQPLIDERRFFQTEGWDWWERIYDVFTERMERVGIRVGIKVNNAFSYYPNGSRQTRKSIYFSLGGQGASACFAGFVKNNKRFMTAHALADQLPMLASDALIDEWRYSTGCSRNNNFAGTLECNYTFDENGDPIAKELNELLEDELELAEQLFHDVFHGYMNDLYQALDTEHEWLTSDQCIIEGLFGAYTEDELIAMIEEAGYAVEWRDGTVEALIAARAKTPAMTNHHNQENS